MVAFGYSRAKSFSVKKAIVRVVVADGDTTGVRDTFKSELGFNGGISVHFGHEVGVGEVGGVVNKDCGTNVPEGCGFAAVGWYKPRSRADKLVHANDMARNGSWFYGPAVVLAFGAPWFAVSFAVGATWANRGWDVCKFMRDDVCLSKEFQNGKAGMTKLFVI